MNYQQLAFSSSFLDKYSSLPFFSCGFTMVLSPVENKSLAENVLSLIVRYLLQLFKQGEQLEEVRHSQNDST